MGQGLQKATRDAKRTQYPGTPEPGPKQVWGDNDKRMAGREVRVDSIVRDFAHCTVIAGSHGTKVSGKGTTRIPLDRFVPNATGYKYLRTEAAEEVKLEAAPIILATYEVSNPSDAVVLDAPSDAVAVAAVAILGVGRYAAKREGFDGPLFLVGGQDEWFREHGGGLTCEAYLLANIAPIAAALKSARYLGQQTSLAPIVDNAHQLAEAMEAKLATSGEPS